jgi:malonyl CoA-acyl carrier protein transacylase
MFEGPEGELKKTENAQPAIVCHSLMVLAALKVQGGRREGTREEGRRREGGQGSLMA